MLCLSRSLTLAGEHILIIQPNNGLDGQAIQMQLKKVLNGAGIEDAHIELTKSWAEDQKNLSGWLHDSGPDQEKRWLNLQGKADTEWDYVIIAEAPEVIETFPGWYAQGVHDVAKEVERGKAKTMLLMQWPDATSSVTMDYYQEVSYRIAQGRDLTVIPAGLAWSSAGKPKGADAAYLVAATIYSQIWNKNAGESSYQHNDSLANGAFETVKQKRPNYPGPFTSAPTGIHTIGGNQNRVLRVINDGWRSRGFPLETINNGLNRNLMSKMGLVMRMTPAEKKGGAPRLEKYGTPDDQADMHYIASSPMQETSAKIYVSKLSNYIYNDKADIYAAAVKAEYRKDAVTLAQRWNNGHKSLRQAAPYLMLSQTFRHFETTDKNVFDVHTIAKDIYAAYLLTMLTGRCPLIIEDVGNKNFAAHQIGYETAWRFSTLHGRAPGFKTWPEESLRMTIAPEREAVLYAAFALKPQSPVTVSITCSKPIGQLSANSLTFTPENYNIPQSVSLGVIKSATSQTPFDVVFSTSSEDVVCNTLTQSWRYSVNSQPTADSKKLEAKAGELTVIHLTGGDPDDMSIDSGLEPPPPITEPLEFIIAQPPSNGAARIAHSYAAYSPKLGFSGTDRFTIRAKDFSTQSEEATVEVKVTPTTPYNRNLLINGDGELFPFSDFGWTEENGTWSQTARKKHNGTFAFYSSDAPKTTLYQDVDVSSYAETISAGKQRFSLEGFFKRNCNDATPGTMSVIIDCINTKGDILSSEGINDIPGSGRFDDKPFDKQTVTITAPKRTATLRVKLIAGKPNGRKNNCYFDALKLTAIPVE